MPPTKKRHRHSPAQIAALNGLYEETEHPTLTQRIELAQSIGLETKSVNSYFQNKRASTKKRPRGVHYISPTTSANSPIVRLENNDAESSNLPPPSDPSPFLSQSETMLQILEPQKIYAYPTTDDTDSTGIWGKKIDEDPEPDPSRAFPPAPDQPSLTERGRRSPSSSVADDGLTSRSRRASSRRSTTPYRSTSAISLSARQRRARPEPRQLDALKELFRKTPTPSIEERSALALEIGMEIGKVTNWFRNLRQSARKRAKKLGGRRSAGSDDDFDFTDGYGTGFNSPSASTSASRAGTPSLEREDGRPRGLRPLVRLHSSDEEDEEDDEAQEAVTPSPSQSPSPASSPSHSRILDFSVVAALHEAMVFMQTEKGLKMSLSDQERADALLLLEFQATCR
ncbi:homeodomain transcription factor [Mycena maculata]|uniref:Homeodomain transcription factor n=1 Tax=Mycena maculata TaxID=230809 RepID=A0AAD7KE97_9AGAR|nr:homeodomain transcription factor [Mycena maculata]